MTKIIFICEGNICRSPTAEAVFLDMLNKEGMTKDFEVSSRATTEETEGTGIYYPALKELEANKIPLICHKAKIISQKEADEADYIIGMDLYNLRLLKTCVKNAESKFSLLLSYSDDKREIKDPYYTRDFKKAYADIYLGCQGLIAYFKRRSREVVITRRF